MHTLTIPVICHSLSRTDFREILYRPLRLRICAALCFVTVRISRNSRRNGETVRPEEAAHHSMSLYTRCRTRWMRRHCFHHVTTDRRLYFVTGLKSGSAMWDIFSAPHALRCGSQKTEKRERSYFPAM